MWDDDSRAPFGGGEYGRFGPGSLEITIRLTGTGTAAAAAGSLAGLPVYTWLQVNESDPAFPDDIADNFSLEGTLAAMPAVEVNGRLDVPAGETGAKVRAWLAPTQDYYIFEAAPVAAAWQLARVVSGTDATGYLCNGTRLAGPDAWEDIPGVVYNDCYRAPSNEVFPDLPTILPDQVVLVRPSPTLTGKHEITPWGAQTSVAVMGADCVPRTLKGRDLVFATSPPPPPPPPPAVITARVTGFDEPSGPYRATKMIRFNVFDVSGGTPPYTYTWDFGDGGSDTGIPVLHDYTAAGSYFPTVTITDAGTGSSGALPPTNGNGSGRYDITSEVVTPPETQLRLGTQFDKTNTTLAVVTGLSVDVEAGIELTFWAVLDLSNAGGGGGFRFGIGGTATATAVRWQASRNTISARAETAYDPNTTLGDHDVIAATPTDARVVMEGSIEVNAAGTLAVIFAQDTASGTSSVLVGSTFRVTRVKS